MKPSTTLPLEKPHYVILDGLRGVAAIVVVLFHLLEPHAKGLHSAQIINHGYLAVDFFFALSGFVIGFAYDDRWKKGLRTVTFFKRRLIRLHPLVVLGSLIGAATFFLQDSAVFPAWSSATVWQVVGCTLLGCTLLPLPVGWDIRGWSEMHPLNGPAWSLYYEYIANIVYALFLRRIGKGLLTLLTVAAAGATLHLCLTSAQGDVVGGWSLTPEQQGWGLTRLVYPFLSGLLLSRLGWHLRLGRHTFVLCAASLVVLLSVPRLGGERLWLNGLYEALCILVAFPLIVAAGSGASGTSRRNAALCRFLGDISYPLYLVHYPFVYVYTAWAFNNDASLGEGLPWMALTLCGCLALACAALRWYDTPVRRWLTARLSGQTPSPRRPARQ